MLKLFRPILAAVAVLAVGCIPAAAQGPLTITLSPTSRQANSGNFTLTVNASGVIQTTATAVVVFGSTNLSTTPVNPTPGSSARQYTATVSNSVRWVFT